MAWTVISTASRIVQLGVPTEAVADAAVLRLGTGYSTQRANDADGNETGLPEAFSPGWYISTGGVLSAERPITGTTEDLQEAARQQRARIQTVRDILFRVREYYPYQDVALAHDVLANMEWGNRSVWLGTLPAANKLGWVQQSALGFTDVTTAEVESQFFNAARNMDAAVRRTLQTPRQRILVASPIDPYARQPIASARTIVGDTQVAAFLAADETTDTVASAIATGAWIDEIRA